MIKELSAEEKDRRYEAALQLQSTGHYKEALELFRTWSIEADESDEKLIYIAGMVNCLNWLGRHEEAIRLVEDASKVKAKSDHAAFSFGLSMASSYLSKGDFETASSTYKRLLESYPEYLIDPELRWIEFDTRIRYASGLLQLKRASEARTQLLRVLQESTDNEQLGMAKLHLGVCHYIEGDTNSAIKLITESLKGLKELRNQVEARFYLGGAYLRAEQFSLAFSEFRFCREHKDTGAISPELIEEMYAYALSKMKPPCIH